MAGEIRIGVSGWRYRPWRGKFYPSGLAQNRELEYASHQFSTLEINGSFYSLQTPESYTTWYTDTPEGFVFAVKGGRYITHMRKLRDAQEPLANFLASGVLALREKLGPILWQFPPQLRYDGARLEAFLDLLPHDTEAAASLARHRAAWMKDRTFLAIDANRPLRHGIEVRHESFMTPAFLQQLRAHKVGLVVAETAGRWPLSFDVTADFVYLRLHGDKELYRSGYGPLALERWSRRIRDWSLGREPAGERISPSGAAPPRAARDVCCYFDNTDAKLRAPRDARALMRLLGAELAVSRPAGSRPIRNKARGSGSPRLDHQLSRRNATAKPARARAR